jgi:hypothetical protein
VPVKDGVRTRGDGFDKRAKTAPGIEENLPLRIRSLNDGPPLREREHRNADGTLALTNEDPAVLARLFVLGRSRTFLAACESNDCLQEFTECVTEVRGRQRSCLLADPKRRVSPPVPGQPIVEHHSVARDSQC